MDFDKQKFENQIRLETLRDVQDRINNATLVPGAAFAQICVLVENMIKETDSQCDTIPVVLDDVMGNDVFLEVIKKHWSEEFLDDMVNSIRSARYLGDQAVKQTIRMDLNAMFALLLSDLKKIRR